MPRKRDVLKVDCPYCGAVAGAPCLRRAHHSPQVFVARKQFHEERWAAAHAAMEEKPG